MPNYSIDAIKIAKAIQKDELSILRGKEFKMRDKIKKKDETTHHPGDKTMKKSKMDRLEESINNLTKQMNARFDRVENRLDKVENRLDKVENRLDKVENRLDYNGLKKIPENV